MVDSGGLEHSENNLDVIEVFDVAVDGLHDGGAVGRETLAGP